MIANYISGQHQLHGYTIFVSRNTGGTSNNYIPLMPVGCTIVYILLFAVVELIFVSGNMSHSVDKYILLPGLVGNMARYCTSVYKYFPEP